MKIFENKYNASIEEIKGDLRYGMECNPHPNGEISYKDIDEIVAAIPGMNDEADWHWVVKTQDNKFWYIYGGCDYTGWDCQSSLRYIPIDLDKSPELLFPETDYYNRQIRKHFSFIILDQVVHDTVLSDS